ncbi:outer membrane lipoprotein-sorting protein [uncultured Desulfosarcina sp.]|uniref:outer membrane lipoprotein-sorting protein n=1 Tax=uncultured Desulfosarcina sp. TaxID=218289 RepID=UPI0029C82071|nr:outer membrane lipoprotein-sorting protein [uncultured Desulfosarcina sp.]
MKQVFFIPLGGLLLVAGVVLGQTVMPTADEIIHKANHMALYQGADTKANVAMVITDKQGRVRKRAFSSLRKNDDNLDRNQKYYTFFQAPADVRKMTFMVHKHADLEKDDDRWLYMPSLDLVKRISASDKRTSFVGSDFLYEDISGRSPEDDFHEMVEMTEDYYVIKNTPKNPDSVEFAHYTARIDKKTFLPMKIEFFKKDGRAYRVIESLQVDAIQAEQNGQPVTYPTVTVSIAKNLESGSTTKMFVSNVRYNVGIRDDIFSERYLRRPPRDVMR